MPIGTDHQPAPAYLSNPTAGPLIHSTDVARSLHELIQAQNANFVSYWPQPQHCWLWRCLEVSDNVEDQQNNNNKRLGVSGRSEKYWGRLKHCGHTARDSFRSLSRLERERGVERANALRASLKRPSLIRQTLELFQKATSGKLLKRSWAFPSAYL